MKVKVAETAGFCFGVKRAVNKVYELIDTEQKPIFTLGPIIHNKGRYRVGCRNICRSDEKYGCYDSYYLDTYIRSGNVFDDEGHD